MESGLLLVAIVLAIIELVALLIGVRLNRSITGAVAGLYEATGHVNRGEFSHRIPVKSNDQLATLAKSFNTMTASLEKLILEQKEKQRMENELVIAQEVQAQLFPRHISQLSTLEVFGFCRPARTVSGDYYDFLAMDADKLLLAVGDISGKGIAAALSWPPSIPPSAPTAWRGFPSCGNRWPRALARLPVLCWVHFAGRRSFSCRFAGPAESPALRQHPGGKIRHSFPGTLR